MTELYVPVVSIVPTKRRRFFWAAWWSGAPQAHPFRRPDGFSGGALSHEAAILAAQAAAGQRLVEIDPRWAGAFRRWMAGEAPFTDRVKMRGLPHPANPWQPPPVPIAPRGSVWERLGVSPDTEEEGIKTAFKRRALAVHPDHGGTDAEFRELYQAYTAALRRVAAPKARR